MKKSKSSSSSASSSSTAVLAAAAAALLLVLAFAAPRVGAATCSVSELMACLPALTGQPNPTAECCGKLKQQQPCMCEYMKDPGLKKYWGSPNAVKVCGACGVPFPPRC